MTNLTLITFATRLEPVELHFRYQDGLFINCEGSTQIESVLWNVLSEQKETNGTAIETHPSFKAFARDKIRAALARYVEDGTVICRPGPKNSKLYSLIFRPDVEGMEEKWREKSSARKENIN